MARLALVAGDFGTGSAQYEAGEFRFSKGRLQSISNVIDMEANATVVQKHAGRAILNSAKNAAALAPVAMVVGVFAAPLALVGTIGIAAAAIGGAVGLLGGGAETKSLIQVKFEQGTGFVAICEQELAATITNDLALMRAHVERERARLAPPRKGWFTGRSTAPEPTPLPGLPAPPPPPESTAAAPGIIDSVAENIASASAAAASTAVETTGQAITSAMAFAKRWTGQSEK